MWPKLIDLNQSQNSFETHFGIARPILHPRTRGSHVRVARRSVCDSDQESWSVKIVLDRLIAPFRGSWSLDFTGVQRTKRSHASVVPKKVRWSLILVAQNSSWSLDRLQKRTLIAWFHFDPGRKRFYRRCVCDYPLQSHKLAEKQALYADWKPCKCLSRMLKDLHSSFVYPVRFCEANSSHYWALFCSFAAHMTVAWLAIATYWLDLRGNSHGHPCLIF